MIRFILFALIISCYSALCAAPSIASFEMPICAKPEYESPTKRFVGYYNYEVVLQTLRTHGLSLEHRNFFEHIIPHEEIGFFGYHSSTQGFRIYQDIIRMVLEEMCEIQIKKDFHFLRIPGKPLLNCQSTQQFLNAYPVVNDHMPDQREQLLSMNYALFGNFNNFGECTIYWFTKNTSATTVGFQIQLNYLFELLGIPNDTLPNLFTIGDFLISMDNAVLFQFFDFSHHNAFEKHYDLVDQMCYDAWPFGVPNLLNRKMMSEMYLGVHSTSFPAQFRLVINNSLILNPYSPLHIKRFERNAPELIREYETNLRKAIRELPYDKIRAMQYRELLLGIWGQLNEK
ncbi:hypothetical protein PHSC3_001669 [Chlamydiales bacterium STE3]|nr:hypothetical protein PHSC3_001669 [Chlamydiales bacterium STE3]